MLFQSFYRIDAWSFTPPINRLSPTRISLGGDANVRLELEWSDEREESYLLLITTIKKNLPNKLVHQFDEPPNIFDKKHRLKSSDDGLAGYSPKFVKFTKDLDKELNEISTNILHLICWKHKIFGGPHRLECGLVHMRWAHENEDVTAERFLSRQYPSGVYTLRMPEVWEGELSFDKLESQKAPLYYELLSDGVKTIETSPRSSLVILVAAIETAIKHYVAAAVPDASWLIENTQSPPLVKLLSSYLELLPANNRHLEKCFRIPKVDLKVIDTSVQVRNEIVHGKDVNLTADLLERLKRVATETIYYFDWLLGEAWAFQYMSEQLKSNIQLNN